MRHGACRRRLDRCCPQKRGYLTQEGAFTSPDGHCRAFDAERQGTVFSNGLGVVVLKRLADALADGDRIYAVIKGPPSTTTARQSQLHRSERRRPGQVIAMAQALAGIDPDTIAYVEAHGTGTPLGDPDRNCRR